MFLIAYVQGLSQRGTGDHFAHNIARERSKDLSLSFSEALGPLAEETNGVPM